MRALSRILHYSAAGRGVAARSNVTLRATFRSRGNSRGKACLSSSQDDQANVQKSEKKIQRKERRAMVEAFVKEYMLLNAGKIPSIMLVRRECGGSHYRIRDILQEIEYKQKLCLSPSYSLRTAVNCGHKSNIAPDDYDGLQADGVCKHVPVVVENPLSKSSRSQECCDNKPNSPLESATTSQFSHSFSERTTADTSINKDRSTPSRAIDVEFPHLEKEGGSSSFSVDTQEHTTNSATVKDSQNKNAAGMKLLRIQDMETTSVSRECEKSENGRTLVSSAAHVQVNSEAVKAVERDEIPPLNKSDSNRLPLKHEHEEASSSQSTFLGNLKSFADGIMKFWKGL